MANKCLVFTKLILVLLVRYPQHCKYGGLFRLWILFVPAEPIAVSKLSVQEKLSFVNVMRDVHNLFWPTFFTRL